MEDGVIFSDESGHDNDNRYGAICTVSGHRKNLIELHKTLEKIIVSFNKNEIKFKEVKGAVKLDIAKQFMVEGLNQIHLKYKLKNKITPPLLLQLILIIYNKEICFANFYFIFAITKH